MKRKVKEIVFSLYMFLFALVTSVLLVLNATIIYRICISAFKLEESTGVSANALMEDYTRVINYLRNPFNNSLKFENFPMSEQGSYHFFEVKNIFFVIEILFFIFCIIAIILYTMNRINVFSFPMRSLNYLFNTTIIIFVSLLVGFYLNFNYVFNKFHEIFFNNDYWIFDERTDPIITALPEEFFMICGIACIVFTIGIALVSKLIYIKYKRKTLKL